jgi:hypothetical protein
MWSSSTIFRRLCVGNSSAFRHATETRSVYHISGRAKSLLLLLKRELGSASPALLIPFPSITCKLCLSSPVDCSRPPFQESDRASHTLGLRIQTKFWLKRPPDHGAGISISMMGMLNIWRCTGRFSACESSSRICSAVEVEMKARAWTVAVTAR